MPCVRVDGDVEGQAGIGVCPSRAEGHGAFTAADTLSALLKQALRMTARAQVHFVMTPLQPPPLCYSSEYGPARGVDGTYADYLTVTVWTRRVNRLSVTVIGGELCYTLRTLALCS